MILDFSGGPSVIARALKSGKERQKRKSKGCNREGLDPPLVVLKMSP